MTCAEIMTQQVAFCSPDDRVDLAAVIMRDEMLAPYRWSGGIIVQLASLPTGTLPFTFVRPPKIASTRGCAR